MGKMNSVLEDCRLMAHLVLCWSYVPKISITLKGTGANKRVHNGTVIIVSLSPLRLWEPGTNAPDRARSETYSPILPNTCRAHFRKQCNIIRAAIIELVGEGIRVGMVFGWACIYLSRARNKCGAGGGGRAGRGACSLISRRLLLDLIPPTPHWPAPSMVSTCVIKLTCAE